MMDRGTVRNMFSFISKNKFEKLMHLVGFIIRIYHDALSFERQKISLQRIKTSEYYMRQILSLGRSEVLGTVLIC